MVPVSDISLELGISPQQVRNLIRKGDIKGEKIGNTWVIDETAIPLIKQRFTPNYEDRKFSGTLPKLKALSFFSGAMGLDIGLRQSGIEPILACEFDKACRATIVENNPEVALIGDILDYAPEDVMQMCGLSLGDEVDLIVGGPPCQAFSSAGKRLGFEDKRGNVFLKFIEHILSIRPKFAVIENVRGLLSAPLKHVPHSERDKEWVPSNQEARGGALKYIIDVLESAGYGVSFNLYNAANYGAPQKRERLIIVCSRDGKKLPFLEPTHSEGGIHGLKKWRTLKEVLSGLDAEQHSFVPFPEKRLKYYRMLKSGQNWRNLPVALQQEALGKSFYAGGGKTGFLRRLDWNEPSPTLVTHPAMPATDLGHPEEDRPLSVQEYKRIQEFPDEWVIKGNKLDQYKQIGNAVPCSLGRAIGKLIYSHLNGETSDNKIRNFPYSRYKNTCHNSFFEEGGETKSNQMALLG